MGGDWMPTKGPKTRRLAEARFYQLLFMENMMNSDTAFLDVAEKQVPEAWHSLEMDIEAEGPKEKVTLYLDARIIAVFRKMGKGYQARINRILETWLQMRMAEKPALQKRLMERVMEARADKDREDVSDGTVRLYEQMLESWAYEKGFKDAMRLGEREK